MPPARVHSKPADFYKVKIMKYKSILLLLALAIVSSAILSFMPIAEACGQEANGCYKVAASDYESTLGFKNANIGLVAFTALFIITFIHERKPSKKTKQLIALGLTIGSALATYFLYLQFFVIKATCPYCLTTDVGIILAMVMFYLIRDKKEKQILA